MRIRELQVGQTLESWTARPITQTDIVRFQGAIGDMNPLHHDPDYARARGFAAPLSVGLYQDSLLQKFLADAVGMETIIRFRVRMKSVVLIGDVISYNAKVVARRNDEESTRVDLQLECRRAGQIVLEAWATCVSSFRD